MMIKANRVYTHLKQIYDDIDALGWKSWVDRCLRNHLQLKLNDQFNRWIVPTATIGFAFLWDRAHQMKRNESQYKANNISGSQVGGEEWRPREYIHTRMDVHGGRRGKRRTRGLGQSSIFKGDKKLWRLKWKFSRRRKIDGTGHLTYIGYDGVGWFASLRWAGRMSVMGRMSSFFFSRNEENTLSFTFVKLHLHTWWPNLP